MDIFSTNPIILLLNTFLLFVAGRLLLNAFTPGLWSIPGPWAAKFTDLWRVYISWQLRQPPTLRALHDKYGIAVRTGPNCVNLSDASLIGPIFANKNDFPKARES